MSGLRLLFALLIPVLATSAQTGGDTAPATGTATCVWPSFRGLGAKGVGDGHPLPLRWNAEEGRSIQWKTPIPGLAHSSPVIWGDRIFLTTAVKEGEADLRVGLYGSIASVEDENPHEYRVLCLHRRSGEVLWSRTAWKGVPKIKRHPKGSHAASTPSTDGEHVVAFFGSEGLYAYDHQGKLLWKRDFGVLDSGFFRAPEAQWGFGSSPVIHEGRVIIQCDVQKGSFLACLDLKTGETLWRTERDEVPTWSTPTVDVGPDRSQVIVNGYKHMGGYELITGRELWKLGGGGDIPVPTPIVAHDLVFITNAHGRLAPIVAISRMAADELDLDPSDCEHMVWSTRRRGNYMQTPLVVGEELYCCNDRGVLSCIEARTGKLIYRERLGGGTVGFTSSGVAGDGKLYFTSEDGDVHVIAAGRDFEVLAVNPLGETCLSTPAIAAGSLYFRARRHLFAVGP